MSFDLRAAQAYVGRTFLLGLSFADAAGKVIEKRQFFGRAVRATEDEGIVVRLDADEQEYSLPRDVRVHPAPKGDYVLLSSGEVITDPDFMAAWVVRP